MGCSGLNFRVAPMPLASPEFSTLDFRAVFEQSAAAQLLLDPSLIILAVTDAYAQATQTRRTEVVGRHLFEVFPDNPGQVHADGVSNLRSSLTRVLKTRQADAMPIQKYDIPTGDEDGSFVERFWRPRNWPILDSEGYVSLIVHQVEDVTSTIRNC